MTVSVCLSVCMSAHVAAYTSRYQQRLRRSEIGRVTAGLAVAEFTTNIARGFSISKIIEQHRCLIEVYEKWTKN